MVHFQGDLGELTQGLMNTIPGKAKMSETDAQERFQNININNSR